MYKFENVTLSLPSLSGKNLILQHSTLHFETNKINVLLGPSGCGKSTVLKAIAGIHKIDSGTIQSSEEYEKNISFVFQEPRLLAWKSVLENVLFPSELGIKVSDPESALKQVALSDSADLFPYQLSGGMKMRCAVARALVTKPSLLLMDEPFSALDEPTRFSLQELLLQIHKNSNCTIIFVTHSLQEALFLADKIIVLENKFGKQKNYFDVSFKTRNSQLRSSTEFNEKLQAVVKAIGGLG